MTEPFLGAKLAILVHDRVVTILRDDIPTIPWPGCWDLPGGAREGVETPEETVLRELKAELDKLEEFHRVFGAYLQTTPSPAIPREVFQGRVTLLEEELEEYREAYRTEDLVEIADALTDLLYVVLGTIVSHGLQDHAEDLFAEVHRSNMSKLDANGKARFRSDGKVIKSDGFFKPDLERILARYLDRSPDTQPFK